jgi:heat-inducible transcriptional repressor
MPRKKLEGLTVRRLRILNAAVREYVRAAAPVGSETLRSKYGIDASSATIRNDMATLERMGLLEQPHISAGRRPTADGYRIFVDNLGRPGLTSADGAWLRSRLRRAAGLGQALVTAANTVSSLTRLVTLASLPPKAADATVEEIGLSRVSAEVVLLAFRLSGGAQRRVLGHLAEAWTEAETSVWGRQLGELVGQSISTLGDYPRPMGFPPALWEQFLGAIMQAGQESQVFVEGARNLLAQPEFGVGGSAVKMMALFDDQPRVYSLLVRTTPTREPRAIIGAPEGGEPLEACGIVVGFYGPEGSRAGRLAVLGPMRMDYEKAVAALVEATGLLSEAWQETLEEQD